MPAAAVCAMPGCPTLVEARRGKDVLYCSESHLTLALLGEVLEQIYELTGVRPDLLHATVVDVSTPIPIRRSGSLK